MSEGSCIRCHAAMSDPHGMRPADSAAVLGADVVGCGVQGGESHRHLPVGTVEHRFSKDTLAGRLERSLDSTFAETPARADGGSGVGSELRPARCGQVREVGAACDGGERVADAREPSRASGQERDAQPEGDRGRHPGGDERAEEAGGGRRRLSEREETVLPPELPRYQRVRHARCVRALGRGQGATRGRDGAGCAQAILTGTSAAQAALGRDAGRTEAQGGHGRRRWRWGP
eukprot:483921-Rhodomonas_salina.1